MLYYRLVKNYTQNMLVPITESPYKYVDDYRQPWFTSCYTYNDEHKAKYESSKSFAGIEDNTTNKLWWDFDYEKDLSIALNDARSLYQRLQQTYPTLTPSKHVQVAFSGGKGFSVVIKVNSQLTRHQIEALCKGLASSLPTFDTKVYDNQRIFRLPLTKHETTGLYKTCLSEEQFLTLSIEQIKELAIDPTDQEQYNKKEVFELPPLLIPPVKQPTLSLVKAAGKSIDWTNKPKWLSNCRWALQNGLFKEGERSTALMCIGSTYKNQGMTEDLVRGVLQGVAALQAEVNGTEPFPDKEIDNNILSQLFSPTWRNGQFTCKEDSSWLHKYCKELNEHSCVHVAETTTVNTKEMHLQFEKFVKDIDKNILYTGILALDKKVRLMVGTTNGFVAPPGAGKTAWSLQVLNHNSKQGIPCLFFSLDMFLPAMYFKILARHSEFTMDNIVNIYKLDRDKKEKLKKILDEEYKNVEFCFKSGLTADEIKRTIKEVEERTGNKIKLIIIDYNELIMSELTDMTASSSQTAQRIRQISNEQQICSITLMQPTKEYFDPAQEIKFMGAAKGSGAVTQALTLLMGCSRPGFDPFEPERDKFFNITVLKNRTGPLSSIDLGWNGPKGTFYDLNAEEREELRIVRENRDTKLADKENW